MVQRITAAFALSFFLVSCGAGDIVQTPEKQDFLVEAKK